MLVNGADIVFLELVAHLVDVTLYAVGAADVMVAAVTCHDGVHLRERLVGECHHVVELGIDGGGEVIP